MSIHVLIGDTKKRMISRRYNCNGTCGKQKKVKSAAWLTLLHPEQFKNLYPTGKAH
jgi:hypothetical protein